MDTSSEDSFAWTSTSNDNSCAEPMFLSRARSPKPAVDAEPADDKPTDAEEPPPKKKKKKHKRETLDETPADLVEKFEAAETVVEARRASPSPAPSPARARAPPAAATPRALEIRERITFEEDSVDRAESEPEPAGRLARYLRAHATRRALPAGAGGGCALGPDDDVWLLRAPRSLRPAALQGAALPLGRGRLKAGGRSYDVAPADGGARAALLLAAGGWRARGVRLCGTLAVRARVPRARAAPAGDKPTDAEEPPPKKKKKKHKRETLDETPADLVEKFEAAETVVEARRASPSPAPSPARARAPPAAATPRALEIRERITFEEDSVDRAESEPEPAGRLARYLRAHATRRALPAGAGGGCALGPDDDVWLLRAPRSLRPAALQGAALPLGRGRLKAGGRSYDVAPADGGARAALLLAAGGWRARGVRLCGTLAVRARVPRARAAPAGFPPPAPPLPLPATRARHPLLGVDFESALAPRPRPRHPTDDDNFRDAEKKKKKKKREREQRDAEAEPAPEPEPGPCRRRRAP